jgi:AcrR family transcriptional regulator
VTNIRIGQSLSKPLMGGTLFHMKDDPADDNGLRGPADHSVREQIVAAASTHFKRFGYRKATVSDLAKAIGFSKAYIYKFFDSKQAIGQAICSACLKKIPVEAAAAIKEAHSASDKLRLFYRSIVTSSTRLFFDGGTLFDIAETSSTERWPSWNAYCATVLETLKEILAEGRKNGEFERKTPIDETARAIMQSMQPFTHPVMLRQNLELLPEAQNEVMSLVLRSLSA